MTSGGARAPRGWIAVAMLALSIAGGPRAYAQDAEAEAATEAGTETEAETATGTETETGTATEAETEAETTPEADAEDESAEQARPDPAEEALETLRSAHLGELASRTRAALQRARPLLRPSNDVARVERRLPRVEADIQRLGHPTRLARIAQLSQRELADLRQEWRRHGTLLGEWQAELVERLGQVEEARSELVELRRQWAALRRASETAGRPEGRHERIVTSLEDARSAAAQLDEQRELVLGLQDRVSELGIVVEDVSEQIRTANAAYRDRLFVRDVPALWEGLAGSTESEGSLASQARASFAQRAETPEELVAGLLPGIVRQLVLFAVLAGLLLVLQRRSRIWPRDDDTLAIARGIVSRPFATALLVALLLTPLVIEHAPIAIYDVVFVLLLVPMVRVLPRLAPPAVATLLYFLAGFLLVNRLESMMPEGSGLRRVLILGESALGIAALAWWAMRAAQGTDRITTIARSLAVAGAAVLAGALVANVVGYLFLSEMLVGGTGFSVYTGLTLVAAVVVAQAMLDLAIRSEAGRRLHAFRDHGALVHRRALSWLALGAGLAWAVATLDGYGVGSSLWKWADDVLEEPWEIGNLRFTFGAVLAALAILAGAHLVARLLRFALEVDVLPRFALEPGVDGAISGMTRYVVYGAGLLLAMAALGIDASQIALVAGALGVGVGFGLQGIVANFIAGIVLMLERPVRLGDFIEVGALVGRVDRIGLRSSTVRALDGSEVIVPNESLISREVVNWTLSDRKRRVEVTVGVAYGTDPHRALEIIRTVAEAHPDVPKDGAPPRVFFSAFGESSLDFVLYFWTPDYLEGLRLKSEVGLRIHDALKEAGIEIPFPQRDLHVRSIPAGLVKGA